MFTTPETVQVVCAARKLPNQEEDGLRDVTIERADSGAFEANAPESETAVTAAIATSVRKKCIAFLKCFFIMVQKLASNIRTKYKVHDRNRSCTFYTIFQNLASAPAINLFLLATL